MIEKERDDRNLADTIFGVPQSLAAEAVEELWWPLARPQDLTETHGDNLTAEALQKMAEDYDPAVEQAAVNIDHQRSGPALGWLDRLEFRGGVLWGRVQQLAETLRASIRAGEYKRGSIEWVLRHATTGRRYLSGFAVLGAKNPAIKSIPALQAADSQSPQPQPGGQTMNFDPLKIEVTASDGGFLVQGQPGASPPGASLTLAAIESGSISATAEKDGSFRIQITNAGPWSLSGTDADGAEIPSVSLAAPAEPAAAKDANKPKTAAAKPAPAKPTLTADQISAGQLLAMEERLAAVEARNQHLQASEAADQVLQACLDRVTPGMIRAGAKQALILAHNQPQLYEIIKNVLAAARPHGLSAEHLATAIGNDLKAEASPALLAASAAQGVDRKKLAELAAKYPGSFKEATQ